MDEGRVLLGQIKYHLMGATILEIQTVIYWGVSDHLVRGGVSDNWCHHTSRGLC